MKKTFCEIHKITPAQEKQIHNYILDIMRGNSNKVMYSSLVIKPVLSRMDNTVTSRQVRKVLRKMIYQEIIMAWHEPPIIMLAEYWPALHKFDSDYAAIFITCRNDRRRDLTGRNKALWREKSKIARPDTIQRRKKICWFSKLKQKVNKVLF